MDKEKLIKNVRDSTYILAEFNAIKNEINHLNSLASSALHISVVASLAVIGILSQLEDFKFILFPIPFFIILPFLFIIISRFQAIMKISGYIRIFLEGHGLHYENRLTKYQPTLITKRMYLSYRKTIFWLHVGLGVLSIGIFISKGFVSWYHILFYFSPSPFYFYAYGLVKKDWRKVYDEYWEKVRDEENGTAYNKR